MPNFGYTDPAAGRGDPSPNGVRGGGSARTAIPQLNASVPIGIPGEGAQQQQGGGGRGGSFLRGIGEGRPGASLPEAAGRAEAAGGAEAAAGGAAAAAGGAEAAGGLAELAPLALAAL